MLIGLLSRHGGKGVSLCDTSVFYFLACYLSFFLSSVYVSAIFFKEYVRSGAFGLNEKSHKSACIESSAYSSTYADSGA